MTHHFISHRRNIQLGQDFEILLKKHIKRDFIVFVLYKKCDLCAKKVYKSGSHLGYKIPVFTYNLKQVEKQVKMS